MAVPDSGTAIGVFAGGASDVSGRRSAGVRQGCEHQSNPRRVARDHPSDLPRSTPRMAASAACLSRPSPPC